MHNSKLPLPLIAGAIILGVLAGLGLWYLILQKKSDQISAVDSGRGLGTSIPTFGGGLGSINTNISSSFSDFSNDVEGTEGGATATSSTENKGTPAPNLWRMSVVPSAGIHPFTQTEASSTVFYFVERVSGNIFSANPGSGEVRRITNTLIPYVYESHWVNEKTVLLRSIGAGGAAATFLGTIQAATSSSVSELQGEYLEPGITTVAANPATNSYLLILPTSSGFVGIVHTLGKEGVRVWESVVGGWRSLWLSPNNLSLIQNSSEAVVGSAYILDISERTAHPVIRSVAGLSASINKEGTAAIYSESYTESIAVFLKTSAGIKEVPIKTLGEKCVWAHDSSAVFCGVPREIPRAPLPDAWYRGEAHMNDDWYKINPESGEASIILSPESDFGTPVDILNPTLDPVGEYITFIDARTGTPWSLRLPATQL